MGKRVFLVVMDSVGCGEMPDAAQYGDEGSNTLLACSTSPFFKIPHLAELGLLDIDDNGFPDEKKLHYSLGPFCKMAELSKGKDTTTGHWELAGIVSTQPMPTFPNGFPEEVLNDFSGKVGRGWLCNKPYSGTEVIKDYGREHVETGKLIIYTSADSVMQIAAHEDVVPVEQLYQYCEIAREMMQGELGVGRIIARPFTGTYPDYERTSRRHDFSLKPTGITMLNQLQEAGYTVWSVGKIIDIFAGDGITKYVRTSSNAEGIKRLEEIMTEDFEGLCFVNLVDFDMKYGHRNDVDGYAKALRELDHEIPEILRLMRDDDILMITADHGCDPITASTDHSREYVPLLMVGRYIDYYQNLGTIQGFGSVAATILEYFGIESRITGTSLWPQIKVV